MSLQELKRRGAEGFVSPVGRKGEAQGLEMRKDKVEKGRVGGDAEILEADVSDARAMGIE